MAASREEVYERVKEVLTEQLGIDEADITQEASFQEDLDADSLDLVELIMELEDQFGIKISAEDELERLSGNRNVLAAVIEAALGALFLQHGFAAIEDAVVAAFSQEIEHALTTRVDYKTDLQELLARGGRHVTYAEISVEGPPH